MNGARSGSTSSEETSALAIRPRVWATNSSIEPEPHRQREHDQGRAAQPDRLDRGDQRPGGGAEQGDVVAGLDAAGLEVGGHGLGLVVELPPRHTVLGSAGERR